MNNIDKKMKKLEKEIKALKRAAKKNIDYQQEYHKKYCSYVSLCW